MKQAVLAAAIFLGATSAASGYYHFVHYRTRTAPFQAIYEKFNLAALPGQTVPFFVAEQGPQQMGAGDSFASLVSQIRLAARTWSEAEGSSLRLTFAGLRTVVPAQASPSIEVVFQELPPGVLALGGPSVRGSIAEGPDGPFVPIERATVVLPADFSQQATWSESFFLTLTHEFGHAVGLQHSLTSSVMSTSITRATTKSKPLALDDVIGLDILYPSRSLQAAGGTIQGRITVEGTSANMASVVALSLDGTAVSALAHPDGAYQIRGIPGGSYYVYAHPLPPAIVGEAYNAGITPPLDPDGRYLPVSTSFETVFYPGAKDAVSAQAMVVSPGLAVEGVNFDVKRRQTPAVFGVQTFSFPGQVAVKPAHLSPEAARSFIVAAGYGLTDKVAVNVLGGSAIVPPGGVKPYPVDPRYLQIDTQFNLGSGEGARHLTFAADGDVYVLPSAFRLTRRLAPQVVTLLPGSDAEGNRIVSITGTGFTPETRILFDGVPAEVITRTTDSITVLGPSTALNQRAVVVALNADGQSSLFLQSNAPPAVDSDSGDFGSLAISPAQLPAGVEAAVEIEVNGTSLQPEYAALALGASGITVRDLWVTGRGRMTANVVVSPLALATNSTVSVINGVRLISLPGAFQVGVANPRQSSVIGRVTDPVSGRAGVPPGGTALLIVAGPLASAAANSIRVTVDGELAVVSSYSSGQLLFRVPAGVEPGPAIVRVTGGSDAALPIAMQIDPPLPVITLAQVSGTKVDASRPAQPGELIALTVANLADPGVEVSPSAVSITVGGVVHSAVAVTPVNGNHIVQFLLDRGISAGAHAMTVAANDRTSEPIPFPVRRN
ncbi:MAG: IPT/TIG domain-containing protein [Bryobacteraceae bacterium]